VYIISPVAEIVAICLPRLSAQRQKWLLKVHLGCPPWVVSTSSLS
jgi:hypothetical protein